MPLEGMEIIAAIFDGSAIRDGFGKLLAILPCFFSAAVNLAELTLIELY
jgi:hypothetical protein